MFYIPFLSCLYSRSTNGCWSVWKKRIKNWGKSYCRKMKRVFTKEMSRSDLNFLQLCIKLVHAIQPFFWGERGVCGWVFIAVQNRSLGFTDAFLLVLILCRSLWLICTLRSWTFFHIMTPTTILKIIFQGSVLFLFILLLECQIFTQSFAIIAIICRLFFD